MNAKPDSDTFDLERFVKAQDGVFDEVIAEITAGRKRTHWMWFVFPQLADLGVSATAKHYGIRSLEEARAYMTHPVLGARLRQCCSILLKLEGRTAHEVFGYPDELKLRSCLTLFDIASRGIELVFRRCLEKYYGGEADAETLRLCPAR